VAHLLANGADVMVTNNHGDTPLHYAVSREHLEVIHELLDNGADPSVINLHQQSPASLTTNPELQSLLDSVRTLDRCDAMTNEMQ